MEKGKGKREKREKEGANGETCESHKANNSDVRRSKSLLASGFASLLVFSEECAVDSRISFVA